MYNRIVLAVDGSENSLRATKEAVKLVSLTPGCQIDVISVADFSKSKSEILHGEPGPTIIEYANKEQVEMVIIGSRGLNALQEMGSGKCKP